jgi:hypothetical protein
MQGLQSLNQFKDFVSSIGGLGRYEDTYIVHAAEGETVVPMEVLDQNPVLKKRLFKTMMEMGIEPGRYIVGNELNSKNPVTGQPEFFLKKIIDRVKKAAADVSGYAAPIIGAMYGAPAGALAGGVLGSFKRENPGDPTQGLNMALRGGAAGIASNLATGNPNILTGRGAYDVYGDGLGKFDIAGLGKRMLGVGDMGNYEGPTGLGSFLKDSSGDYRSSILQKYLGSSSEEKELINLAKKVKETGDPKDIQDLKELIEKKELLEKAGLGPSGSRFKELLIPYLTGTIGFGALIDATSDDGDIGLPADTMPEGNVLEGIVNPVFKKAEGGVMDLQDGGESVGPGTGTSDSIPAMLSDGEFVMTAKAVRGAGGGDRREGAKKMYEAMDNLEARA